VSFIQTPWFGRQHFLDTMVLREPVSPCGRAE
jgi:hypothetical protein